LNRSDAAVHLKDEAFDSILAVEPLHWPQKICRP
jgi:hypothetical protein